MTTNGSKLGLAIALNVLGALLAGLAGCSVPSHYVLVDDAQTDAPGFDGITPEGGRDGGDAGANEGGFDATSEAGDGAASEAGDAGADGGDAATWPPSGQSIAVVCTLMHSCTNVFGFPTQSLADCIDNGLSGVFSTRMGGNPLFGEAAETQRLYECAAVAFDCTSLASCLADGHDNSVCPAPDAGVPRFVCVGDDLVDCTAATPVTVHCADWGMQCQSNSRVGALCTNGVMCSFTAPRQCSGDDYLACDRTTLLQQPVPCSKAFPGTTCQMVATTDGGIPQAQCLPAGPSCTQANPHCVGTTLVECDRTTMREVRTDCATLYASTCMPQGATAQCALGNQCDTTVADTCPVNDTIRTCLYGSFFNINCRSLGFSTCFVSTQVPTACE